MDYLQEKQTRKAEVPDQPIPAWILTIPVAVPAVALTGAVMVALAEVAVAVVGKNKTERMISHPDFFM